MGDPTQFGLKDVIRGIRETFPLASFRFQYPTPGQPPRVFVIISNNGPVGDHRIILQPKDEDKTITLILLVNTWGDGSEMTHWESRDSIKLEVAETPRDDLVGWLSCVRADIPADQDISEWDKDEVVHLRHTARMCWLEYEPSERFPLVRLHGAAYETSDSKWNIVFLRPGESRAYILNNQGHPLKHAPEALIREIDHAAEQVLREARP